MSISSSSRLWVAAFASLTAVCSVQRDGEERDTHQKRVSTCSQNASRDHIVQDNSELTCTSSEHTQRSSATHPTKTIRNLLPLSPKINLPLLPHPRQRLLRQHIRRRRPPHAPIPALATSPLANNSLVFRRSKPQPRRSSLVDRNANRRTSF